MALTENQFEEAVSTIVDACHENEQFKNDIIASINGSRDDVELSDDDLQNVSGGFRIPFIPKNVYIHIWKYYRTRS